MYYLGPYIVGTLKITVQKIDHCHDHNFRDDANYCAVCGRNHAARIEMVEKHCLPEEWDLEWIEKGEFFDDFVSVIKPTYNLSLCEDGDVFILRYIFVPKMYLEQIYAVSSGDEPQEITIDKKYCDQVANLPEICRKRYQKVIEYLLQWFSDVHVCFGFVTDGNS